MIPENLTAFVRARRRVLITSHANPDGDAIGSGIGLARLLAAGRQGGRRSGISIRRRPTYRALPGSARDARPERSRRPAFPTPSTAWWFSSARRLDRTGLAEHTRRLPLVNIDHHLGNSALRRRETGSTPRAGGRRDGRRTGAQAGDRRSTRRAPTACCSLWSAIPAASASPTPLRRPSRPRRSWSARAPRPERVSQWFDESQPEGTVRLLGEMLGPSSSTPAVGSRRSISTRACSAGPALGRGLRRAGRRPAHDRRRRGGGAVARDRPGTSSRCRCAVAARSTSGVAGRHGGGGHHNAAGCKVARRARRARRRRCCVAELVAGAWSRP